MAKTLYHSDFSANDVTFGNQITTICCIYKEENPRSAREIAIKEDLELYEEINNKEKLITSLKNSPLLEISTYRKGKQRLNSKTEISTTRREKR